MATSNYKPVGTYNDADLNEADRSKVVAHQTAYNQAKASGDEAGMSAANQAANAIRSAASYIGDGAGYSGGRDGSQYIPGTAKKPGFTVPEFDTDAKYDADLKAKYALLEANYNTNLNDLENSYNQNNMELGFQKDDIGVNYGDAVKGIQDQTYRGLEQGKTLATQRGIMNSAQGQAMGQGMVRAGNESMNMATRDRDMMLNQLSTRINNLSQAYQGSKNTLTQNYGLGKVGAQSEALSNKLGADMSMHQFNTGILADMHQFDEGWERQKEATADSQSFTREMANLQNKFNINLSELNHTQQRELAQLSIASQEKLAALSRNASASQFSQALAAETKNASIERSLALFGDRYGVGTDTFKSMSPAKKEAAYTVIDKIGNGEITSYPSAVSLFNSLGNL